MKEFSLIRNDNQFYNVKDDLANHLDEKANEKLQELEDLYNDVSTQFQDLLTVLVHEDNDYINLSEFKNFISTKYSYSNFESIWNLFEEFKNYHQKEQPWENVNF